ncbi:MAG: four helix bundle protein [Candidatus Omnitrophica bacterium]|nr:four helix bundle protein [Candidatus Omnitrophota bacterium]MBD3269252.1 four helix bundle protein [Candidatus Omnitrophota bacterium]
MKSYKDLDIYKLAHRLAVEVHKMTLELPRFEMYEEGSQIRKSSKGIVSTIVEGFGRKTYQQDYLKFMIYAHSSCDETKEHLELLFETNSLKDKEKFDYFFKEFEKLSKMINKFIQSLKLVA